MEWIYDPPQQPDELGFNANFEEYSINLDWQSKVPPEQPRGFEEFSVNLDPDFKAQFFTAGDIDAPTFGPTLQALDRYKRALKKEQERKHKAQTPRTRLHELAQQLPQFQVDEREEQNENKQIRSLPSMEDVKFIEGDIDVVELSDSPKALVAEEEIDVDHLDWDTYFETNKKDKPKQREISLIEEPPLHPVPLHNMSHMMTDDNKSPKNSTSTSPPPPHAPAHSSIPSDPNRVVITNCWV